MRPLRSLLTSKRSSLLALLLVVALAIPSVSPLYAQSSGQIFYLYDSLGRLVCVVDQQGNAATYNYDAVGNILSIERFHTSDIPGNVGITLVNPGKGKVGTPVAIFGKGFGATPAENSVNFNGAVATVTSAAANRIVTTVPAGATTGPITVTAQAGSATSPTAFRVLGAITVTPASVTLQVNQTQQFLAQEAGTSTANVIWGVNGLIAGDSVIGTITPQGLYTAPATASAVLRMTVTATHKDDPTLSGLASATIQPPLPVFLTSPNVSVGFVDPPIMIHNNVTASVSVSVATSAATPATVTGSLSVQVTPATPTVAAFSSVAATVQPVITSVSPASGARGTTNLSVTLAGSGFTSATALAFLRDNSVDGTITVSNLVVNGDGTQATADISIASGAATGDRIMRLTTPSGSSTAIGTGGNLFTVQ